MVDVAWLQPRGVEGAPDGLLAHLEGHAVEGIVALREALQRSILVDGQRQVPAAHLHRAVQLLDALEVEVLARPERAEDSEISVSWSTQFGGSAVPTLRTQGPGVDVMSGPD